MVLPYPADPGSLWLQHAAAPAGAPLLADAQPGGESLAAYVRALACAWPPPDSAPGRSAGAGSGPDEGLGFAAGPAEAWAALRCLPHACATPEQARP